MPRRLRTSTGGLVYHVMNRGVGRMDVFEGDGDYAAFERVLAEALERERGVRLLGYCLMPNHWHLVVWPRRDGELSEFMRWLTVTHTQRWHAHRHTSGTGPVYQGRYKSFPIQQDGHLLTVLRYVESNARRGGLVRQAERWRWGSLWRWGNRRKAAGRDPGLPAIGGWPVDRPGHWRRTVNAVLSKAEAESVMRSIRRGAPYGSEGWTGRTARRLGIESSLNPIGRPRNDGMGG
jgi:REP-associated tyrosine transposase